MFMPWRPFWGQTAFRGWSQRLLQYHHQPVMIKLNMKNKQTNKNLIAANFSWFGSFRCGCFSLKGFISLKWTGLAIILEISWSTRNVPTLEFWWHCLASLKPFQVSVSDCARVAGAVWYRWVQSSSGACVKPRKLSSCSYNNLSLGLRWIRGAGGKR